MGASIHTVMDLENENHSEIDILGYTLYNQWHKLYICHENMNLRARYIF